MQVLSLPVALVALFQGEKLFYLCGPGKKYLAWLVYICFITYIPHCLYSLYRMGRGVKNHESRRMILLYCLTPLSYLLAFVVFSLL